MRRLLVELWLLLRYALAVAWMLLVEGMFCRTVLTAASLLILVVLALCYDSSIIGSMTKALLVAPSRCADVSYGFFTHDEGDD